MNQETINNLNNLNQKFYDQVGSKIWNQSQDYSWQGWFDLVVNFEQLYSNSRTIKFLDLGCGNARFANFLRQNLQPEFLQRTSYTGVDFSNEFLDNFDKEISGSFENLELLNIDILKDLDKLKSQKFDCIVLFGLIHHIPSVEIRNNFIKEVSELLSENGILVFTTWEYMNSSRLSKRVLDLGTLESQEVLRSLNINKNELEHGDNILDWIKVTKSYRYSHSFEVVEIKEYLANANLELRREFYNDGRSSRRNKYYICGKNTKNSEDETDFIKKDKELYERLLKYQNQASTISKLF